VHARARANGFANGLLRRGDVLAGIWIGNEILRSGRRAGRDRDRDRVTAAALAWSIISCFFLAQLLNESVSVSLLTQLCQVKDKFVSEVLQGG
jgi:hypothetical protein